METNQRNIMQRIQELEKQLEEYIDDYEQKTQDYWSELTEEEKLKVFYFITKTIVDAEKEGVTYRELMYDKFGFGIESYAIGMYAGFMDIHNALNSFFHETHDEDI